MGSGLMPPMLLMLITEPPPRSAMIGKRFLCQLQRAFDVDGHDLVEDAFVGHHDWPENRIRGGVIDDDVDAAKAGDRLIDQGLQVGGAAGVAATASASPPAALIALATASMLSCLRLLTITLAPNSARPRAIDSPIPLLAPVTIATLPVRSNRRFDRFGHDTFPLDFFRLFGP